MEIKEYLEYKEGSDYGENREWKCKKFRKNRKYKKCWLLIQGAKKEVENRIYAKIMKKEKL